jgi:hypothetical protein
MKKHNPDKRIRPKYIDFFGRCKDYKRGAIIINDLDIIKFQVKNGEIHTPLAIVGKGAKRWFNVLISEKSKYPAVSPV